MRDQVRGVGSTRHLDFQTAWESAASRGYGTREQIFALGAHVTTLEAAIQSLVNFLGLDPLDHSDRIKSNATQHTLLLAGSFRGGKELLVRAKLALTDQVTMQLTVRTPDPDIADFIITSVG